MDWKHALLMLVLGVAFQAAHAADDGTAPAAPNGASRGGARASDPLANLEIYEQRRYRMDMDECRKQTGVDRKVCQRSVRNKAASKSRRRGAAHH